MNDLIESIIRTAMASVKVLSVQVNFEAIAKDATRQVMTLCMNRETHLHEMIGNLTTRLEAAEKVIDVHITEHENEASESEEYMRWLLLTMEER